MRPRKPCAHPGCPALVDPAEMYCPDHKALHPEPVRSAALRGYGPRWQKVSRQYLAAHPLCVRCLQQGVYTKATVVDHIRPHRGDPALFWDQSNWQSLCKRCHDRKTAREDRNCVYTY